MGYKHVVFILLATVATFLFVSVRLDIVRTSYGIHGLERKERALRGEISELNARIGSAKSPQRLEAMARKGFGLRPPSPQQTILLSGRDDQ